MARTDLTVGIDADERLLTALAEERRYRALQLVTQLVGDVIKDPKGPIYTRKHFVEKFWDNIEDFERYLATGERPARLSATDPTP